MSSNQQTADEIKEIVVFCLEHRGRCFAGWSANKIFKYVAFHFLSGTLFLVRDGDQITGVAIGWLGKAAEFLRRDERGIPQFAWGLPEKGNALLIADVFGSRETCGKLWEQALKKWPKINRVFTYRQGGQEQRPHLIEFTPETLKRFYGKEVVH